MEFFVCTQGAGVEGIPNILAADCLANLSDSIHGHSALGIGVEQTDRQLRALVFDRVFCPLNEFPIAERPLSFLGILKQLIISMSFSTFSAWCTDLVKYVQHIIIYAVTAVYYTGMSVQTILCGVPLRVVAGTFLNHVVQKTMCNLWKTLDISLILILQLM